MSSRKKLGKRRKLTDYSLSDRFYSLLAGLVFAAPTAAILWFQISTETALYIADVNEYIGMKGFVAILGSFALIAIIFPGFFPSLLGWVWRFIIKEELGDYGIVHFFAFLAFLVVFYLLFGETMLSESG